MNATKAALKEALKEYNSRVDLLYGCAVGRNSCGDAARKLVDELEQIEKVIYYLGGAGMENMLMRMSSITDLEE